MSLRTLSFVSIWSVQQFSVVLYSSFLNVFSCCNVIETSIRGLWSSFPCLGTNLFLVPAFLFPFFGLFWVILILESLQDSSSGTHDSSPARFPPPYDVLSYMINHEARFKTSRFSVLRAHSASLVVPFKRTTRNTAAETWHKRWKQWDWCGPVGVSVFGTLICLFVPPIEAQSSAPSGIFARWSVLMFISSYYSVDVPFGPPKHLGPVHSVVNPSYRAASFYL